MTRVCFLGSPDVTLRYELLSRETSREALSTYDLERPFENALAVRTVSVGAAVSLCNDLQWYLSRFVDEALVQEPSVSEEEWLSRGLAEALRNGEVDPAETGEYLKVYGVERDTPDELAAATASGGGTASDSGESRADDGGPPAEDAGSVARLVEPLYVRRTDDGVPEYDLREVDGTVVVRLTRAEYSS